MADIIVCADESGIHGSASVCLLSGYIGSARQWMKFDDGWERILQKYSVADFHAKEFFAINQMGSYRSWNNKEKRSYRTWTAKEADKFLDELLDVIRAHNVQPLGAMVDIRAFRSLTYGERRWLTGGLFDVKQNRFVTSGAPSKPYFLLFQHCLVEGAQKTKDPHMKVLFVFDEQKVFESRAHQTFHEAALVSKPEEARKFGGVIFHRRDDCPGLQAADLYTHCWHRYLTDPKSIDDQRDRVLSVAKKMQGMKAYTAGQLERMLNKRPDLREKIQHIRA